MERGRYGRLTSVVPPITVPAWSCMMASRTPGRPRDLRLPQPRRPLVRRALRRERRRGEGAAPLGLSRPGTGKPSIVLGVPGTYPPRPLNGVLVSCFLTPSTESQYTYPPLLAREVEQVVGEYLFDCTNFRTDDKDDLLAQVYEMTDRRFRLADHLLRTKPWELFAMVEMGIDRMHHAFWKAEGRHADAILDYHRHVDGARGRAARARRRRHGGARRLRPRREAAGGRDPDQRVAAPRGAPPPRRPSRTAAPRSPRSASTGPRRPRGATAATTAASS